MHLIGVVQWPTVVGSEHWMWSRGRGTQQQRFVPLFWAAVWYSDPSHTAELIDIPLYEVLCMSVLVPLCRCVESALYLGNVSSLSSLLLFVHINLYSGCWVGYEVTSALFNVNQPTKLDNQIKHCFISQLKFELQLHCQGSLWLRFIFAEAWLSCWFGAAF